MKSFSSDGRWWFQDNPENQYPGHLNFDQFSGGVLDIEGSDEQLMMLDIHREKFFILGDLEDGRRISLWISFVSNYSETNDFENNIFKIKCAFYISYIIIGDHIQSSNIEDLKFSNLLIKYSNLDKWIDSTDLHNLNQSFNYVSREITIHRENNHAIVIQFLGKLDIIREGSKTRRKFDVDTRFKLHDESFENIIYIKNLFQDFLNLTITTEVTTMSIKGIIKQEDTELNVEIIYWSTMDSKMNKLRIKTPCIFTYSEIKNDIDRILGSWFSLYDMAGTLMNLYFGVMYNSKLYNSNIFLMLYQALEVFHTLFLKESSINLSERTQQLDSLINKLQLSVNLEEVDKKRIIGLINRGKNLSTKEKIIEVYTVFEYILPKLSSNIKDRETFIKKTENYRNRLTHGGINYDELDNEDLYWSTKDLQLILQLCILKRIGFSIKDISKFYFLDKSEESYPRI
jgi:hypothetical protein